MGPFKTILVNIKHIGIILHLFEDFRTIFYPLGQFQTILDQEAAWFFLSQEFAWFLLSWEVVWFFLSREVALFFWVPRSCVIFCPKRLRDFFCPKRLRVFKATAFWADAFYRSKCPSVCLSVCLSIRLSVFSFLRYRLNVFFPPLPKVGCSTF